MLKARILHLLLTSEPLRPGDIAESLNVDKKELEKAIKELKAENKIFSPKRCFYSAEK